jgi:pimeloyl-ACP methyl ester carboxylesterase
MATTPAHVYATGPHAASVASPLAFDRTGQGEPLVLLHGQGLSRRAFDPVVPALAAARDVIAVDRTGHGQSPRQPSGTGSAPRDLAVAVAELLDELDLPTAHVPEIAAGAGWRWNWAGWAGPGR